MSQCSRATLGVQHNDLTVKLDSTARSLYRSDQRYSRQHIAHRLLLAVTVSVVKSRGFQSRGAFFNSAIMAPAFGIDNAQVLCVLMT